MGDIAKILPLRRLWTQAQPEHVLFECINTNYVKARRKFGEGYCIYVSTYMYKPLPLKTKEILNVEPECHEKDIEKATSLICTFLKSVYHSMPLLKAMEVDALFSFLFYKLTI